MKTLKQSNSDNKKSDQRLDRFLGFLYEREPHQLKEVRKDLESWGVDIARLESSVTTLLSSVPGAAQPWLMRAREKKRRFDSLVRVETEKLSRDLKQKFHDSRHLVQAVIRGELGPTVQKQALVFFRNHKDAERRDPASAVEKMSDRDLRSLVEDCQLLDLLEEDEAK